MLQRLVLLLQITLFFVQCDLGLFQFLASGRELREFVLQSRFGGRRLFFTERQQAFRVGDAGGLFGCGGFGFLLGDR